MATNKNASESQSAEPAADKKAKRKLKNQLRLHTPFVKWYVGLIVCGKIERRFTNRGEFGEKENLEIKLADACTFTTSDGEILTLSPGDAVNVGKVAGLGAAMSLDVGRLVQIECTGKKEMGKGKNDAWDFEVTYE